MKIGILTFHYARNYGATLQAFGLQEVLKTMGHQVQILDYHNPRIAYLKSPFAFKHFITNPLRYLMRVVNIYHGYRTAVMNFKEFERNYLNVTPEEWTKNDVQKFDGDYIIIGSDQVWNPLITGGPDPVYWGMNKPAQAKLLTYAASSGDISLFKSDEFLDVAKWLINFNAISVREERLKEYVETHSGKEAKVVVDPTILAGKSILEKVTAERVIKERYVLLYHVESSPSLLKIARCVSRQYNAKLVSISQLILSERIRHRDIQYYQASVCEMLSLIKYAECVVALSFHGTALSVLFEKDFYSVRGKNMARVESLLSKIGLMDRVIDGVDVIDDKRIDWKQVREKLIDIQNDSLTWLKNSLSPR